MLFIHPSFFRFLYVLNLHRFLADYYDPLPELIESAVFPRLVHDRTQTIVTFDQYFMGIPVMGKLVFVSFLKSVKVLL